MIFQIDSCQWIGLSENLQESPILNAKIYGFWLRCSQQNQPMKNTEIQWDAIYLWKPMTTQCGAQLPYSNNYLPYDTCSTWVHESFQNHNQNRVEINQLVYICSFFTTIQTKQITCCGFNNYKLTTIKSSIETNRMLILPWLHCDNKYWLAHQCLL